MKNKYIILCLFLSFLISCALPSSKSFTFDNPRFDNMQEACEWINQNIKYKKDYYDDWKLPQETLDDRNGDCEDMAILLMGIMKYQKNYESELLIVKNGNNAHAIVLYQDKTYDCTNGISSGNSDYQVKGKYDYNTVMYMAKYIKNY